MILCLDTGSPERCGPNHLDRYTYQDDHSLCPGDPLQNRRHYGKCIWRHARFSGSCVLRQARYDGITNLFSTFATIPYALLPVCLSNPTIRIPYSHDMGRAMHQGIHHRHSSAYVLHYRRGSYLETHRHRCLEGTMPGMELYLAVLFITRTFDLQTTYPLSQCDFVKTVTFSENENGNVHLFNIVWLQTYLSVYYTQYLANL